MNFKVACDSQIENKLLIPIVPVVERIDLDSPDFLKLAQQSKVFRLSDSVSNYLINVVKG